MVEVFKTNVSEGSQASELISVLQEYFPGSRVHLDLHDIDKVLRVEGENFTIENVLSLVRRHGFDCALLEG